MDKEKFLKRAGFRSEVFKYDGVSIEIRELSLNQRRAVIEASGQELPTEAIAALTVSMSSPMWTEDDVETLIEQVRPDILVACAQRVYELSNMVEGARTQAKKPSESRRKRSLFSNWRWRWVSRSAS